MSNLQSQKQILEFISKHHSKLSINTVLQYFQLYSNRSNFNLVLPSKQSMVSAQQYKPKQPFYYQRYYQYFQGISKYTNMTDYETQNNLKNHHIRILNDQQMIIRRTHLRPIINIKSIQRDGAVVVYQIFLSKFQLQITLLNFEKSAPSTKKKQSLGKGKDVEVRIQKSSNRTFAVKRCFFDKQYLKQEFKMKANKFQIEQIITQVAITKICSLYRIGPAVDTEIGFDLLCFNNCIEFYLQICLNSQSLQLNPQNIKNLQRDLKRCLYIMHKLQIIHRDIKPENILFSRLHNSFILGDFGLSHPIIEPIGYKTHMKEQRGTFSYMNDEFKQLKQYGDIDLYQNDLQALEKTIIRLIEKLNQIKQNKIYKKPYRIDKKIQQQSKCFLSPQKKQFQNIYSQRNSNRQPIFDKQQNNHKQNTQQFLYQGSISASHNSNQNVRIEDQIQQHFKPIPQYIKQEQKSDLQSKQITRFSQRSMMSQINYEFLKLKYKAIRTTRFTATIQEFKEFKHQQIIQILEIILDDHENFLDLTQLIKELKSLNNEDINKVIQRFNYSHSQNQIDKQQKIMDEFLIRVQGINKNQSLSNQKKQIKQEKYRNNNQRKLSQQFINKIIKIIGNIIKTKAEPELMDLLDQLHKIQPQKPLIQQIFQEIIQIRNVKANESNLKKNKKKIIPKQIEITQAEYKQKYDRYFSNVDVNNLNNNNLQPQKQMLESHRIRILQSNEYHKNLLSHTKPSIQIKYTEGGSSIFGYNVIIGKFQLEIILFNFKENALTANNIGKGCFGQIRLEKSTDKQFIVKRQYFKQQQFFSKEFKMKANKLEIQLAIVQLSIYKICSVYKIGPAVNTFIGFDLLCFNDCIQFHLQVCDILSSQKITQKMRQDKMESFYNDIKRSIYIMHALKIVHKDIKPDNILFSKEYNKFVLSDFGLSHPISEDIGKNTQTYKQGTPRYMSNEMKMIERKGLVNLYQNDIHGFKISLMEQYTRIFQSKTLKEFGSKKEQDNKNNSNNEVNIGSINYTYLKFKYFTSKIQMKLNCKVEQWQQLNQQQMQEIANIVSLSTEKNKIIQFYIFLLSNQIDERFSTIRKYMSIYKTKLEGKIKLMEQKQPCNIERLMFNMRVGYKEIKLELGEERIVQQQNNKYPRKKQASYFMERKIKSIKQRINYIINGKSPNIKQLFYQYLQLLKFSRNHQQKIQRISLINHLHYQMIPIQRINYLIQIIKSGIKNPTLQKQFQSLMQNHKTTKNTYFLMYLYDLSIIYTKSGFQTLALEYALQNSLTLKNTYGQIYPYVADAYIRIGSIYCQMRKLNLALQYTQKALKISKRLFGQFHTIYSTIYNQLAWIHKLQCKYNLSLEYLFKSLSMNKIIYQEGHILIGIIYCSLSDIYLRLDQYQLSIQYLNKVLPIYQKTYGKISQQVVDCYYQASVIYTKLNNYMHGLAFIQQSIKICKQLNHQNHFKLAHYYHQIAMIYYYLQKYQLSLQYCFKSIQINQLYTQSDHTFAKIYHLISMVYIKIFQYQLALQYLNKSIRINKQLFGEIHTDIATNYLQFAVVYLKLKQFKIALEYCLSCARISKQIFGEKSSLVENSYKILTEIYFEKKQFKLAIQYCLKLIFIKYSQGKGLDNQKLNIFQNLAKLYVQTQKYIQACRIYQNSLSVCLITNPINHLQTLRIIYYLGVVNSKIYRPIQAYHYFKLNYGVRLKYFSTDLNRLQQSLIKLQEIQKQYPEYTQNYKTHQQFLKNIQLKYSKLRKDQLMKMLISKKRILRFEVQFIKKVTKKLKLTIEILLCYKYLNCTIQMKNYANKIKQICDSLKSGKQRQLFKQAVKNILY